MPASLPIFSAESRRRASRDLWGFVGEISRSQVSNSEVSMALLMPQPYALAPSDASLSRAGATKDSRPGKSRAACPRVLTRPWPFRFRAASHDLGGGKPTASRSARKPGTRVPGSTRRARHRVTSPSPSVSIPTPRSLASRPVPRSPSCRNDTFCRGATTTAVSPRAVCSNPQKPSPPGSSPGGRRALF